MVGKEQSLVSATCLSRKKQLVFALFVLERMLPNLLAFSARTGFDQSCYLRARDAAWAALQNGTVDESLKRLCLKAVPDTDEYSDELTSYALNTALAVNEILEFISDGCSGHIMYVSTLATDSVDLYLSSLLPSAISSPKEDTIIARHPLMQQELQRQQEDAQFLFALPDEFDNRSISALMARASNQAPVPGASRVV